jgi:hypothetical protein
MLKYLEEIVQLQWFMFPVLPFAIQLRNIFFPFTRRHWIKALSPIVKSYGNPVKKYIIIGTLFYSCKHKRFIPLRTDRPAFVQSYVGHSTSRLFFIIISFVFTSNIFWLLISLNLQPSSIISLLQPGCSRCVCFCRDSPSGPGPPHSRGFYITYNDAPQSVGLLWTSNQLVPRSPTAGAASVCVI